MHLKVFYASLCTYVECMQAGNIMHKNSQNVELENIDQEISNQNTLIALCNFNMVIIHR